MKKKISFVTTSLVRSGAERVTYLLAKHCFELGYDVEIIMLLYHDIEFEIPEGIKVVDFAGTTSSRIKRIHYWIKNLRNHFKERKPDVVVSFIARINILTLMSIKDKDCNVVISERNDPRYDSRTWITRRLVNLYYPKATHIVFQTEEAKQLFNKKIQSKGVVIENPITIKEFASKKDYDENLITFAGRYSEQKDIFTILKAAKITKEIYPSLRYELYGTGSLKDELIQFANENNLDNVTINDNIPNINEKMRQSFLFVMSSLYEGMSNSLLEASYAGVPCVVTPTLGTSVIKEGENGFFFPFKDYEKLAEIIVDLKSDSEKYNKLRLNSIKIAKETKHEDTFKKWLNLL